MPIPPEKKKGFLPSFPPPSRESVWWLFGLAMLVWVLFTLILPMAQVKQIPYSEFKAMVREGRLQEVTLGPSYVSGIPKDDKAQGVRIYTAVKVDDPDLIKELEAKGVPYRGELEGKWAPLILSWLIPIALLLLFWKFILDKLGGAQRNLLSIGQSKAKLYVDRDTGVTFDDVAGVDEAKDELREIIDYLREPEKYRRLGGTIPKGVLLVGPPGTGKTLLARAVAGEARVPFFSMSGSEFVEMFVGVGAARVRDLFEQAQQKAPCIIFIDELDALGKVRSVSPVAGGHEEREHTLQQLLVEMDGFDSRKGVIIMAATNRPEILDPALLRPGRFDRHVLVDRPDIRGREDILRVHCKRIKLAQDVDIKVLAARTTGFVGADLANVVNEAALLAARRNKSAVEMEDFEEAINRLISGLEKKRRVMSQKEQEVIAYHESGHALVAESLPQTDRVHRISIIPRGIAALGYTLQLPTQDRYLITRSELLERLTVLLAGRTAEELVFQEISTGAQDDLERATSMARSMVSAYGMSEKLGPMTYGPGKRPQFLEETMPLYGREISEETAREIDQEVRTLMTEAHQRAHTVLEAQRDILDTLAHKLLEKETIEGDELREIISTMRQASPTST
ncbi:ATP-dependent zinc metalloprotease FtsH [Sulfuricella sp. T08]|uniref:ATP-dependent zinc metalloprotease FtsH n=1 Tax=Sulfuricella sp. T08 TaxID=1632857 RepID=UPI0009E43440|nr:ATP-dependent zinc metalloprotease FtsH [Sulfuricella sp. T08]